MSLNDDEPLTGYEQGALGRSLATPEADKWWAGLPPNTRKAIMQKLLSALSKAESPRDIGTLSRSLMKADELDLKRQQGVGNTFNGPVQINIGEQPIPKALQSEDGRNVLNELRRVAFDSDPAASGKA